MKFEVKSGLRLIAKSFWKQNLFQCIETLLNGNIHLRVLWQNFFTTLLQALFLAVRQRIKHQENYAKKKGMERHDYELCKKMLASIYFSSFCLAVKVNENPTMGGDGDGEEVTFEEGDDVEEEDADIDAVSVLLIMMDYVQISSQWTALESLKLWKLKLGANEGGIHVLYWWGGANEAKLLYF